MKERISINVRSTKAAVAKLRPPKKNCRAAERDVPDHNRYLRSSRYGSLAAVVAAADAAAADRRTVEIARCPHCAELLILPACPVIVTLAPCQECARE
jgi:hypothetical protein